MSTTGSSQPLANLTDIFITHGHADHWFAAQPLVERFGARIVASAGTIAQMHANVALRPWLYVRPAPSARKPFRKTAVVC